jgi:hypothetical protein
MFDSARKDVSDCFDPTVWVPGEACQIFFRLIASEIIEKEKRIKVTGIAETECAVKMHARTLHCRLRM